MIKETTTDPSKEHINEKKYKLFLTVFKRGSNKFFTDRRTVTPTAFTFCSKRRKEFEKCYIYIMEKFLMVKRLIAMERLTMKRHTTK